MIGTTFDTNTTAFASKCIDWAEAEVDKFMSKRYDVSGSPFNTSTSIPPLVTAWTEQMATAFMLINNTRNSKETIARGEKNLKMVMDNMQAVVEYKAHLVDQNGSPVTESENTSYNVECNTSDYSSTFNEDDELQWAVDSDKLDAIKTERD